MPIETDPPSVCLRPGPIRAAVVRRVRRAQPSPAAEESKSAHARSRPDALLRQMTRGAESLLPR